MSEFDQLHAPAAAGTTAPARGRAPGKRTLTQDIPAKKSPETEMTGYRDLDDGLACDGLEGQTPECFLDAHASTRLEAKLNTASLLMVIATITALGNVYLDLRTKHKKSWGPAHELIFLVVSTAILGPLAGMGASAAARAAVALAEAGGVKAAWSAASIDPSKILGILTMLSKGFRTSLAHPDHSLPSDKEAFVKLLQDQAPSIAGNLMEGVAAEQLNHHEQLELLARLSDPTISGRGAIEARARALLEQFDKNRIGVVGNVMDLAGGYEVAAPVRVKVRKQEFMVLCESHGHGHDVLALNGANMDESRPPMTMESLVFVRIVEPAFHDLMTAEYTAKRKQDVPFIDFNQRAERTKHRWFDSLYVELMHNTNAHQLAIGTTAANDEEGGGDAAE